MKKITIILGVLFTGTLLFAKPATKPEWLENHRAVFPSSEYIAQKGSGDSAEQAKIDASNLIARYFKSNITVNTVASREMSNDGIDKQHLLTETSINSNLSVFGLEYTSAYYHKPEKRWYAVAFINREDAWTQIKPKIESAKGVFYGFYNKAQDEEDVYFRIKLLKNALSSAEDFEEILEYGRLINPDKEEKYAKDRDVIASIPASILQLRQSVKIKTSITGDYAGIIENKVVKAFEQNGYTVGKSGDYTLVIDIDSNVTGSDPLAIYPFVRISLLSKSGKSVYSCEAKLEEKTVAFSLDVAQKKAFPKLAELIQIDLSN